MILSIQTDFILPETLTIIIIEKNENDQKTLKINKKIYDCEDCGRMCLSVNKIISHLKNK